MTITAGCNYQLSHYDAILETAGAHGYHFLFFDAFTNGRPNGKFCLLRHDIDYAPEWTLNLANIEATHGVHATYFFQICAKTYNLREAPTCRAVKTLHDLGHKVGLHFDPTWHSAVEPNKLAACCQDDKKVFEAITGITPCDIVSFHNTHRIKNLVVNRNIPDVPHVYERRFFSDIKYLSDSQGWYEDCVCKIFNAEQYKQLQLLVHPYLWPAQSNGQFVDNIAQLIDFRQKELTDYFLEFHPVCKTNEASLRKLIKEKQL